MSEQPEKTFIQNIMVKVPIWAIAALGIWFGAGKAGFPIWWQIEFVVFSFYALCFFILLDLPALKPEKGQATATIRLFVTYGFASILFIGITKNLPQFNPEVELEKLNKPPVNLASLAGPEVIAAGREVFEENKCFNCHKVFWEGNSDRGPNLGTKQIGLYSEDYIKKQILEPRIKQSPGFDDPKSKKAMPTYYGEDLDDDQMSALVAYLKTLRDPEHAPVEGKFGAQWTWWDDQTIVKEGKVVFEGLEPNADGLNCAVCHGKEGIPLMSGALDFRDANRMDTEKMPDRLDGVPLKEWPDALWYRRVTRGVDGTPMMSWGMIFSHLYLWKAEAYAKTFHNPLPPEGRATKYPVPPIPTKEDIERWTKDGLFMDPLL
jgi:mono/diheme cytochrome c family protein